LCAASFANMHDGALSMVWVESWIHHALVGYLWDRASSAFTYVVILFKGFTLLTNLGYADPVPYRCVIRLWPQWVQSSQWQNNVLNQLLALLCAEP
jgi:hypothetical protein